jgi:hypothetical protein
MRGSMEEKQEDTFGFTPAMPCDIRRAFEPQPGDRVQSQVAKPDAYDPDLGRWEDEGGNSGLRA